MSESLTCYAQEALEAGSVADTPYAQVPPLPPWMAGVSTAGGAGTAWSSGPPAYFSSPEAEATARSADALAADVLAQTAELRARMLPAPAGASALERPRTRSRAAAEQPIRADVLNQALGEPPPVHLVSSHS